jgi:hypothetical protein
MFNGSTQNEQSLQRTTFHRCFIPSFGSFGKAVSEEKIFFFPVWSELVYESVETPAHGG